MGGKAIGVILGSIAGWLLLWPAVGFALPAATALINHVDTTQAPDIHVFLTVLDDSGNPIPQLGQSDLQLLQDGAPQEIAVSPSTANMAIVLAMDTSGSMGAGTPGRQPIDQARLAAESFVTYIKGVDAHPGASLDQIAILSFNEKPTLLTGLSADHNAAINAIRGLKAEPKWTSLYDAAYRAVKIAGEAQLGQRAVILFTDGWDEGPNGKPGSAVTFDDVVNLARQDNVPIYPIGLGVDIDQPSLGRMATLTGGSFLSTSDPAKLTPLFQHIAAQLKSKYLVTFQSSASAGDHNIQVTVRHDGGEAVDHRSATYPKVQPVVQIVEPKSGSLIQGDTGVVLGVGKYNQRPIVKVEYRLGGQLVRTVESQPFIFHLNPSQGPTGTVDLEAAAFDSDGLIGTDKVSLTIAPPPSATALPASPTPSAVSEPTAAPLPIAVPVSTATTVGSPQPPTLDPRVVAVAIGVVGLGIILAAFVMGRRRRSAAWTGLGLDDSASGGQGSLTVSYGSLTIVDGPELVGRVFPLPSEWIKIGREGSNLDVVLPDPTKQVSRDHAAISCDGASFLIQDLGSLNGTRVDGKPIVAGESVGLTQGVEILVANTYRLRFSGSPEDDDASSRTRPVDPVDTLTL